MNLEEKLTRNSIPTGKYDVPRTVIFLDDALSICQKAVDEAKIELLQECSIKAIEYQYGKLGGLAMTLHLQDRIKELKEKL